MSKCSGSTSTKIKVMSPNLFLPRCHQHYAYGPACTYDPPLPHAPLPGVDYDQPLLVRNPESAEIPGTPPYQGPSLSSCQTPSTSLVQISAVGSGLVWQYGGQQSSLSGVNPSTTDESNPRNINSAKEFSIRIISVWGHIVKMWIPSVKTLFTDQICTTLTASSIMTTGINNWTFLVLLKL